MSSDPVAPGTGPATPLDPVAGSVDPAVLAGPTSPVDPVGSEEPTGSPEQAAATGPAGPVEPVDLALQAVLAVPGVHDLHAGVVGEVATYLPGRRVNGLRLKDDGCVVHVVLEHGVDLVATADRVRDALRGLVDGPIDVTVEDVVVPTAAPAAPGSGDPA